MSKELDQDKEFWGQVARFRAYRARRAAYREAMINAALFGSPLLEVEGDERRSEDGEERAEEEVG